MRKVNKMVFYMVTWKEFKEGKMSDRSELIKELEQSKALYKMKEFNAQKRLTTTDYSVYDLSALFGRKGLQISELIKNEDFLTEDEIASEPKKSPEDKMLNLTVN